MCELLWFESFYCQKINKLVAAFSSLFISYAYQSTRQSRPTLKQSFTLEKFSLMLIHKVLDIKLYLNKNMNPFSAQPQSVIVRIKRKKEEKLYQSTLFSSFNLNEIIKFCWGKYNIRRGEHNHAVNLFRFEKDGVHETYIRCEV